MSYQNSATMWDIRMYAVVNHIVHARTLYRTYVPVLDIPMSLCGVRGSYIGYGVYKGIAIGGIWGTPVRPPIFAPFLWQ